VPQLVPAIDRQRPGEGYRHHLLKRDIERFVELIPRWEQLARGLDVIVLAPGRRDCDGWYNRGVIGLCAWPINLIYTADLGWYLDHCGFLKRIETRVEEKENGDVVIHWTPDTVRAYLLCHVFLHELGHHHDRMTTRSKLDNAPRGEQFAEKCAWEFEERVLEAYLEEFGLPD
jgi:hypothetical protein